MHIVGETTAITIKRTIGFETMRVLIDREIFLCPNSIPLKRNTQRGGGRGAQGAEGACEKSPR
jgi:hypothetical protein